MAMLIALIPAIGWGIQPVILGKIGGKPTNQILGTGIGALIIGLIINYWLVPAAIPAGVFWLSLLSGAVWIVGQLGQYKALKIMGVAKTMPLTTGLQLIGTSVISVLFFGEWATGSSKLIGAFAILLLIVGAMLTSYSEQGSAKNTLSQGFMILLMTSFGYWVYSALPKMVSASSLSIFFPQMLGVFLGAVIYVAFTDPVAFKTPVSWRLSVIGLTFSISALAYIFSAKANGVVTAFIMTQLNVVVATLGGLMILHEMKTPKELRRVLLGLVLIVVGSIITVFL
ncbi:GRP family sugar transporter [Levilactobacillus spicheri]|uniref:Sugar transporter n=1 Tax=Levilactobacillus spicheri TaxID=216463 RepID=A0A0F3RUZ2_9LACO|nr:GRP family sugar transporter [Levilactobacillus spicheri]KJW12602.1 sugar transporter [Levilactobacillus spicheri]